MNKLLLALSIFVAVTGEVRAQDYIPPPIIAPPPAFTPAPSIDFDQGLKERGRRNKIAGGLLMGFGSLALAAGQGLVIYALVNPQESLQTSFCKDSSCSGEKHYDAGMIAGGAVLAFAGFVMNVIGIPVYAVGGSQMRKADHRLQVTASGMRLEF